MTEVPYRRMIKLGFWFLRDKNPQCQSRVMTRSGRHGGSNWNLRGYNLNCKGEIEKGGWEREKQRERENKKQ